MKVFDPNIITRGSLSICACANSDDARVFEANAIGLYPCGVIWNINTPKSTAFASYANPSGLFES